MKKLISVILAVLLFTAVLSPSVFASDDTIKYYVGDDVVVTIDKSAKTLTVSGSGALPDYSNAASAPWYLSQYAVTIIINDGITAIGSRCFANNKYTTSVVIGSSVEYIGVSAFSKNTSLASVSFPSSLKTIDEYAFYSTKLTSVTLPDSLEYIGPGAFESCSSLSSISIPDSLKYLCANAFLSTAYYKALPAGINLIGDFTLQYKGTVTETVTIPDGAKVISANTLIDSSTVKKIIIPDSVEKVLASAFYNDSQLKYIEIPDSVSEIGDFAFGYKVNSAYYTPEPMKDFTVYGHGGTAAEKYADECDFEFECFCEENGYTYYPDCLTGGVATVCCIYCGNVLRTENIEPKDAHSFGDEVTVTPGCETDGETYIECELCGYKVILDTVPATGHTANFSSPLFIEPTCTEKGMIGYFCSICGKVCDETIYLAPKGHTPSKFTTGVAATCTESGTEISSCKVCGEILEEKQTPPLGHKEKEEFDVMIKSDILAYKQGFRVKKCERCGVAVEYGYFMAGDVNGNGKINTSDLAAMKRVFADNPAPGSVYESCDVNGDGRVNSADLAALKRYLAGYYS